MEKKIVIPHVEMPSEAEVMQRTQQDYLAAASNPTCFANWFPAVEELGIRTPKSDWIPVPADIQLEILRENVGKAMEMLKPACRQIRAFGEEHGYPLFIKNSLFSAKHSWKNTCFIAGPDVDIENHVALIFYEWAIVGMGAGMARHIVVREFIDTKVQFYAFSDMPVTQEFRLFADKGKTYGYQPYWPEAAVREPSIDDWRTKLREIEKPSEALLSEMIETADKITDALDGDYSVDFLIDKDGKPWLIDMAEARTSFMCPSGFVELNDETA